MKGEMYLGPARPYGLPLMSRAVLLDVRGVPGLAAARQEHPLLDRLFVPLSGIMAARRAIEEKGSALQRAYQGVLAETLDLREKTKGGK